jgi:hypothetical protein
MKRFLVALASLISFSYQVFAGGFDIKTSDIFDQPGGVEVLGDYNGFWYAVGFETMGTLHKPPRYKLFKYATGVRMGNNSSMYPSFGDKTLYLKTAIINNKICMFYAKCEKLDEVDPLLNTRDGHSEMPQIYRQDYDVNTLEPIGGPQLIFEEADDHFSATGIAIAESDDKSKAAVLIKPYYRHHKYKVILTDNKTGQVYNKIFDFKPIKDLLAFHQLKVSNTGQVFIEAKVREDEVTLNSTPKGQNPVRYYFFSISSQGDEPKSINFTAPISSGKYSDEPLIGMLANGDLIIAYNYFTSEKSTVVKGISIAKYDGDFNLTATKDIAPDASFLSQAADYGNPKKETGYDHLEIQQILPMEGNGLLLIAEAHKNTETKDKPPVVQRNYLLTFWLTKDMALKDQHFIAKKQNSARVNYAFSAKAYRRGNDVYLFHNDDWEADGEHSMSLQCTYIPATGGEPVTQKIVRTSDDFYTCLEHIYPRNDGKILFTEEKIVEFDNVSREVKLLEVTLK